MGVRDAANPRAERPDARGDTSGSQPVGARAARPEAKSNKHEAGLTADHTGLSAEATTALAPLLQSPGRSAVLLDFDGTLAPIVDAPADAHPIEGAMDVLAVLARRVAVVAVVSGRPVEFLAPFVPDRVVVAGLYGLEVLRDGRRTDHPGAAPWRAVVDEVARRSVTDGPAGMVVESKGLSLTLHYRTRHDLEHAVAGWASAQAARSGLVVRPARMSVELHPPIAADKGSAVDDLVHGVESVCFVGDDRGDLPAFDALDRLETRGVAAVRVAVASDEVPGELVDRADLVVDGPSAVLDLLRHLAA
jgi:trehalose 6-phosphate phosphatase